MAESEFPPMPRPRCCPEPRCTPIYSVGNIEGVQAGESWSCWGRMAEPVVFVYDGVEHANDLNTCHATPLKGLVRFQQNFNDWLAFEECQHAALLRLGVGHGPHAASHASMLRQHPIAKETTPLKGEAGK